MDTIESARIFFIISSIGFVLLWVFASVLIWYIIKAVRTFSEIMERIDKDIETIGDTTQELLEDVRNSTLFRLIFGKNNRKKLKK